MRKKVLAALLAVTMALSIVACGNSSEQKNTDKKETSSKEDKGNLKAEKNLLSVEVTLPASLVGDSEATLDEEAKAAGVKDIIKNEDGSVTMKMTKKAHKALLEEIKTGIDEGLKEILEDKENYPSFDSITYNDDVTQFDVKVDAASYDGLQSFVALAFYIEGNMYQTLNAVPEAELKTIVNFINKDTGEIIESGDSTAMSEEVTTE